MRARLALIPCLSITARIAGMRLIEKLPSRFVIFDGMHKGLPQRLSDQITCLLQYPALQIIPHRRKFGDLTDAVINRVWLQHLSIVVLPMLFIRRKDNRCREDIGCRSRHAVTR